MCFNVKTMEIKKEVKVFKVEYKCKCGAYMMIDKVLTSYPPKYEHKCCSFECKETAVLDDQYPLIRYE